MVWIAPAGSEVDGASIPRVLWSFFGGPFEGKHRNASVLHDVAYDQKSRPWQQVDRMSYDAMRCSGVGPVEAKTFYYALYRHGRHWKFKKKPEESRSTAVDPAEVNAIQQWIKQNNPSLVSNRNPSGRKRTLTVCAPENPTPQATTLSFKMLLRHPDTHS